VLAARTGLKLFHNHLVLDAITAVFDFRSPPYLRFREQWWLEVFEAAARERISLIFTFMPETSLAPGFGDRVRSAVKRGGGRVRFVELVCSIEVQEARLDAPSRGEFAKLRSVDDMRSLRADGWLDYPMPQAELKLDTGAMPPDEAAAAIQGSLGLPLRD
jgi:hypothetical protein